MNKIITYYDLNTLLSINDTTNKLKNYLTKIGSYLNKNYSINEISFNLNIENKEYVSIYKKNTFTVKIGFCWLYGDVYFGIKLSGLKLDYENKKNLENILNTYEWGYLRDGNDFIISQERRLSDFIYTEENEDELMSQFVNQINEANTILESLSNLVDIK